jgi:hypothetical protein
LIVQKDLRRVFGRALFRAIIVAAMNVDRKLADRLGNRLDSATEWRARHRRRRRDSYAGLDRRCAEKLDQPRLGVG